MANFQKIQLTRSGTAAAVPAASDLELGELAINYADGKLFFENSSGSVVDIADINSGSGGILTADRTNNRIGINQTSPSEALHVTGTIRLDGEIGQFNASAGDSDLLNRKEYIQFSRIDSKFTGSGTDGARIYADATAGNTNTGDLVLSMADDGSAGGQSFIIRNEDGSNASAEEGVGYKDLAVFQAGGANSVEVGIGTSTPQTGYELTIHDKDGQSKMLLRSASSTFCAIDFGDDGDNDIGSIIYDHNDNSMRFDTADVEAIRISNTQNVGIGRTPTSFRLEVVDDIAAIGSSPSFILQDTDVADTHETIRMVSGGSNDAFEIQQRPSDYSGTATNLYRIERDANGATTHQFRIGASSTILSVNSTGIVVTGTSSATTLTDGTASINSGAITGATTATFSGNVTATTAPSTGDHLTNKTYVDSVISTSTILNTIYPNGKRPAYYQDTTGKTATNDRFFRRIQKISDPDSIVTLAEAGGGSGAEHATNGTRMRFNANGKYQVRIGVTFDDNDSTSGDGYRLLVTRESDHDGAFVHGLNGGLLRSSDNSSASHNAVMQEIINITDHTSLDQQMLFYVETYSSANVNTWSGQLNLEILKLT